ncbi:hypothetical protein LA345_39090 (plasmid) [Burkholderia vietnamiensis]|uniref:Uncharacterized protein n=1 Tax=Burkholderia vietnamiensis (strain G4 / LMG 22486) TaxID=269482 RepID=A4JWH7_BURVG|nr:hypothetical protein Bcep1808_7760 [Burkholderia vietnamiensis G4]MCB4349806.1 hypothetical protein [Burkholderia vietnamiensis]
MNEQEFKQAQETARRACASGTYTGGFSIENKGGDIRPFVVYGWGEYPESSVLAGQTMKQFIDSFDTEEQARALYPQAEAGTHGRSAHNSVSHLPGEDDPVPGGMYHDGI